MNVNKKGFTIIELIMVIVIISILSLVLVPNIITFNNKNKIKSCESLEKNIISVAKIYVTNNKYDLGFDCSGNIEETNIYIQLKTLVNSGDLSSPITNPMTKDKIDLNKTITVTYDCTNKTFTYNFTLNCT